MVNPGGVYFSQAFFGILDDDDDDDLYTTQRAFAAFLFMLVYYTFR